MIWEAFKGNEIKEDIQKLIEPMISHNAKPRETKKYYMSMLKRI